MQQDTVTQPGSTPRLADRQWHVLFRVLYLYAVLHPAVGYMSGMHQMVYVLARVLAATASLSTESLRPWEASILGVKAYADTESDLFWCFSLLIDHYREWYEPSVAVTATSPHGPRALLSVLQRWDAALQRYDMPVWQVLDRHALRVTQAPYAARWLTRLLAADVPTRMTVELWDVLFMELGWHDRGAGWSSKTLLAMMGTAMLVLLRGQILELDSAPDANARLTQLMDNYPGTQARPIVALAWQWYEQQAPGAPDAAVATASESDRRRARLQERLASTVQRGLHSPKPNTSLSPKPSPTASPDLSSEGSPWRRYKDAIQDSDAAAAVSKVSSNLAARALAWRTRTPSWYGPPPAMASATDEDVITPVLPMPKAEDEPDDSAAFAGHRPSWTTSAAEGVTAPAPPEMPIPAEFDASMSFSLPSVNEARRRGELSSPAMAMAAPALAPPLSDDATARPVGIRRTGHLKARRTPSQGSERGPSSMSRSSMDDVPGAEVL